MSDIYNPLDKFGQFIVENMRDRGIDYYDKLVQGSWKASSLKLLQENLNQFDEKQLCIIRQCIVSSIDTATHDFLFALQESSDLNDDIQIIVDGHNVAELSDGLDEELYSEYGWYDKYSYFGEDGSRLDSIL
ncbi:hypothetical protein [Clostridium vincentii]|uniref:Uncharacterized protein n=1 Tax=Clostridium vincentii TaxID=52704 RepID=A0A2T0B771_9CLOT|nr:hypothetical protein [Clostridium vincentii]PRR79748.1 hypothetical protein CLVI_32490 [Clostridium vincentii]